MTLRIGKSKSLKWISDLTICVSWTGSASALHFTNLLCNTRVSYWARDPVVTPSRTIQCAAAAIHDRLNKLRALFAQGVLVAKGTFVTTGAVREIDRFQWERSGLQIDIQNSDLIETRYYVLESTKLWTGVSVELRERLGRPVGLPKRRVTKISAENECRTWLQAEMSASPNARPKPKRQWWQEAQERWGDNLSQRAFERIWAESIKVTGVHVWSFAGAPRKSARKSPR
jgi:hypothetical protein